MKVLVNRKRLLVVGAGAALCAVLFFSRSPEELAPFLALEVSNPQVVAAGEPFEVSVTGAGVGEEVQLTVDAGYGPRLFSSAAAGETTTFEVPASMVAESGIVMLQATTDRSSGWSQLEVTPDEAVDPIDLYLGPRTVVADDEHYSMIVAVPTDRFGNPVANGTTVEFIHYTPADVDNILNVATANLLAFAELKAGTTSGRSRIATTVGSASGQQRTFNEVAGITIPFTVEAIDQVPFADGASLLRIETSELVDLFGNQLPDGTLVVMTVDGDGYSRRLSNVTIDGVASFTLEAPSGPAQFDVRAESGGSIGEPFDLVFSPAVLTFDTEVKVVANSSGGDATELVIGPVVTVDGAYVPDGTEVIVDYGLGQQETVIGKGFASVPIDVVVGEAAVTILGHSETVDLGRRR